MDAYGFSDYAWPGDVLTHTLGGYQNDHMIAGSAISWLRGTGKALADEGKPWSLFVSLVNPTTSCTSTPTTAPSRCRTTASC